MKDTSTHTGVGRTAASRRGFLALTGAAGTMSIAGCVGGGGGGETVTVASLNPMSWVD